MSTRLTRKEIKHDIRQDEVRNALANLFLWLQDNVRLVLMGAAGVVGLVVAGLAFASVMESRREAASEKLAEAIEIYQAPVVAEGEEAPEGANRTYATDEERRTAARGALEEVKGGVAEDVAALYLAELALDDGDTEAARSTWERFVDRHSKHALALSVRLNLLSLDRQSGQAEAVASELEQELASSSPSMPEDVLLFELGQTYDELGRKEEAQAQYQRILDDFPRSPYSAAARERAGTGT